MPVLKADLSGKRPLDPSLAAMDEATVEASVVELLVRGILS